MNCREGDTAYVVWPGKVANNHVVEVKHYLPPGTPAVVGGKTYKGVDSPAWWVKCPTPVLARTGELVTEFAVRDANLRPIGRPGRGGVEERQFQRPVSLEERISALQGLLRSRSHS